MIIFSFRSPHLCKLFTFLFKDIRLLNFWWMTIEGLFFHHIVAFPFYELARYQKTIYWCGWMTSHLVMLIYTSVRLKYGNDRCWTDIMGYEEWIFLIFPYICLGVSLVTFPMLSLKFQCFLLGKCHIVSQFDPSDFPKANFSQIKPIHSEGHQDIVDSDSSVWNSVHCAYYAGGSKRELRFIRSVPQVYPGGGRRSARGYRHHNPLFYGQRCKLLFNFSPLTP